MSTSAGTRYTLAECVSWDEQRRVFTNVVGGDLSLPAIVRRMVGGAESWDAVVSFCEGVMSQKETAEREREISTPFPGRRKRTGPRPRFDGPETEARVGCRHAPLRRCTGWLTPQHPVHEARPGRTGPALARGCGTIRIPAVPRAVIPTVVEPDSGSGSEDNVSSLEPPMIVHCSAGVGRTGALVLCELALALLARRQPLYPLDLVRAMRAQRPMCIQNAVSTHTLLLISNIPPPAALPARPGAGHARAETHVHTERGHRSTRSTWCGPCARRDPCAYRTRSVHTHYSLYLTSRRQPLYPLDLVRAMRAQRPMCIQNAVSNNTLLLIFSNIPPPAASHLASTPVRAMRRDPCAYRTRSVHTHYYLYLPSRRQPLYPLDLVRAMRAQRPMCIQNAVSTHTLLLISNIPPPAALPARPGAGHARAETHVHTERGQYTHTTTYI
ncbi:unnamed protein product [Chrysodeixis includens]|uniref:Uncharacterized protein n=1 Tax=Chrysodeixis includens TaxID=689277 RepID=A0A9P0BP72_CHRIL|nr:unnamed protein product [Chrysodeixis includens]